MRSTVPTLELHPGSEGIQVRIGGQLLRITPENDWPWVETETRDDPRENHDLPVDPYEVPEESCVCRRGVTQLLPREAAIPMGEMSNIWGALHTATDNITSERVYLSCRDDDSEISLHLDHITGGNSTEIILRNDGTWCVINEEYGSGNFYGNV